MNVSVSSMNVSASAIVVCGCKYDYAFVSL